MITVDISNVWGQISLPNLLAMEREVEKAHEMLMEGTGEEREQRGWLELPGNAGETDRIRETARKIRENSDACVIVGTGGSYLGAREYCSRMPILRIMISRIWSRCLCFHKVAESTPWNR